MSEKLARMQRSILASVSMLTECYRQFDEGSDAYKYYVKLAAEGGRNLQAYDAYQQRGGVWPGLDGITPPSREQAAQYEVLRQQITATGYLISGKFLVNRDILCERFKLSMLVSIVMSVSIFFYYYKK